MKILMVNKFLYSRGGAENYALRVAECLQSLGHEVQFFGMFDEKNTVGNRLGEYTTNMDFHTSSASRFLYPIRIIYSHEAKKKIGKVLDDFKPDIVHMNNINFQLTPSIIDAIKKRGIPLVQTVHDYQMICPNHLLYDFEHRCICEKCVGKNKFHCIKHKCIHGSLVKSILGTLEYYFYSLKGTYRKVDRYICPSIFLEKELLKAKPSVYRGKTIAIHNFIEKNKFTESTERKFDFPYVAFAGRLSPEKGINLLAEVAKLLPDVQFVVMGNGPEENALVGIPNVTMTGFLSGRDLISNVANADVVAVPSVWFENCPLSILEAQILGVPCVTMNWGGMAELVSDGETGGLCDEQSPEAYARVLLKVLSDREKLAEMKKNCLKAAESALDLEAYCHEMISIYEDVICQKSV